METKTARIRALNDELRQNFAEGTAVMTPGIAALGAEAVARIVKAVAVFDDFCHANDPHEEHDFGGFDADGHRVFFKIDYKETASPQAMAPMAYRPRYRRRGNDLPAFHSLWVGKAGGELLRSSPPLTGASVLSASRFVPLVPFPFASSTRFSRSVQVDHRHCRPAANETMLGLRRAVGTEVVHWLGANKPAYKLDPGFLEHPRLSPRAVIAAPEHAS